MALSAMSFSNLFYFSLFIVAVGTTAVGLTQSADAFTAEEIVTMQEAQEEANTRLAEIKAELEENRNAIDASVQKREDLKSEISLLKRAEADDTKIFLQEVTLSNETAHLRELKLDRIKLLDEQSQLRQHVNILNDSIRYNVIGLDESEVEFVSSVNINLQISIDDLTEQLGVYDQILDSIDAEVVTNDELIATYQQTRDKYHNEYVAIQGESKTSWEAVAKLADAQTLVDSFDAIISTLKIHSQELVDGKKQIINERQTIESIIEVSTQQLIDNKADESLQKRLVGLKISNTCKTLITYNFTTDCPSYHDLINLDSSNTEVSGEFVTDPETGFFHRGPSNYVDSWRWYDNDDRIRLILDPPQGMASRIPMVIIENNFGVYFEAGDHTIAYNPATINVVDTKQRVHDLTDNSTDTEISDIVEGIVISHGDRIRNYHSDRHIDGCYVATISTDVWETILTDTIRMLRTGCIETTIQSAFIEHLPVTDIDITSSPNWQYNQWLNSSKDACKTICKQY